MSSTLDLATATLRLAFNIMNPAFAGSFDELSSWGNIIFSKPRRQDHAVSDLGYQLKIIVGRLAEEMTLLRASEFGDVSDEDDLNNALDEITKVFHFSGLSLLPFKDFADKSLTPTDVTRRLAPEIESRWEDAQLSNDSILY